MQTSPKNTNPVIMDLQRFEELGGADHGWLKAKHHFSFGSYYNPQRMGFGNLRVINDDRVQVMSAGTGVTHSEYADGTDNTVLYQIWIEPREKNVAPRWKAAEFPKDAVKDALPLLVSGRPEHANKGALFIHADAAIYGGRIAGGNMISVPVSDKAYLLVSAGEIVINGERLFAGDGAAIEHASALQLDARSDSEVLAIDLE